jgi:3-methyladenine DNA glycosylase AlkC
MTHPAQRFRAPGSIEAGVPLKRLLGRTAVELIGESFVAVHPAFDHGRFTAAAQRGLGRLGILDRGAHIATALAGELPREFPAAVAVLLRALGPPLPVSAGFGLAPFFYLPHACFIAANAGDHIDDGLRACREVTRRFTAEFCIRPLLIRHQDACLATLATWAADPDVHVRRLVSEGTRPRLPWAMRLPAFQRDPTPVLPLLEALKDDPDLYVRRSVANHLGDIAKDHPATAFAICARWTDEVADNDGPRGEARRWMVRHAVRLPAKQGVRAALRLRTAAAIRR